MRFAPLVVPLLIIASPAAAQLRPLVDPPASVAAAADGVDVVLINEGDIPQPAQGPARLETIAKDGTPLTLVPATSSSASVAPGGFAKLRYVPAAAIAAAPARAVLSPAPTEQVVTDATGSASAFIDRFRPYRPIYGAFGTGDAGGKLQFSFALRPFGGDGALSHLNVAYTQTLFWAIDRDSGPIRTTTYSPEIFADLDLDDRTALAFGYQHDSNGEGPARSIDVNRISLRATRDIDLGGGWHADITPRAWFYVGRQGVAPDLDRYWGYTSLTASIAQADGWKLSLFGRGNPGTGKGAGELLVSYPVARLGLGGLGVYVIGEAFTGYGEALSDYDRRASHARLGIAFTR